MSQVYHLASVRLRDLCAKLDVSDELRKKIWTCFEYSLVHCPEIMMDRHLDQLLMCAIYVMTKVNWEQRKSKQKTPLTLNIPNTTSSKNPKQQTHTTTPSQTEDPKTCRKTEPFLSIPLRLLMKTDHSRTSCAATGHSRKPRVT